MHECSWLPGRIRYVLYGPTIARHWVIGTEKVFPEMDQSRSGAAAACESKDGIRKLVGRAHLERTNASWSGPGVSMDGCFVLSR